MTCLISDFVYNLGENAWLVIRKSTSGGEGVTCTGWAGINQGHGKEKGLTAETLNP